MHVVKLLVATAVVSALVAGPVLAQEATDPMMHAPSAEAPKMEGGAAKGGKHHKKHVKKHHAKHHKKAAAETPTQSNEPSAPAPAAEPAMDSAQ